MLRPKSIRLFELFYLGSVLVAAIQTAMEWSVTSRNRDTVNVQQMLGPWFPALLTVFLFTLWLILWYFVARARSNVARWAVVVLYVFSLLGYLTVLGMGSQQTAVSLALSTLGIALDTVAVFFLFRRDAVEWFGKSV